MYSNRLLFKLKDQILNSSTGGVVSFSTKLKYLQQLPKFGSNNFELTRFVAIGQNEKRYYFTGSFTNFNNNNNSNDMQLNLFNRSKSFSMRLASTASSGSSSQLENSNKTQIELDVSEKVKEIQLTEIGQRQLKIAEEEAQLNKKRILAEEEKKKLKLAAASAAAVSKSSALKSFEKYVDPYVKLMRLHRPSPIQLAFWPSAWGILGAAAYINSTPDYYLLLLFAMGSIAMRSAGCIVNDIWDKKFDKQVERTKDRPLTNGTVGIPSAVGLLGVNLSIALSILLQLNLTTQVLGACSLFPAAIYPAAKRFTNWPQAILGVTYNWGALMGWSSIICSTAIQSQSILAFLPVLPLYIGCINWTIFYDTIYGFQDKKYDEKLGLKSTAITLQKRPKLWLLGFSSAFTSNLALYGYLTSQEPIYYITVGLAMAHLLKQIVFVKLDSAESCQQQFKSNNLIGALIAFGLFASIYIKQ